jgi:hypothetical protein
MEVKQILEKGDPKELKALFGFTDKTKTDILVTKFRLWAKYFFPKYFQSPDAPFHLEMDRLNVQVYRGEIPTFVNIVFRGGAKTTRTKLFFAFCIANDLDHSKRYMKVLTKDTQNSTQVVTDIYNMLIQPRVKALYPEIFTDTETKREETMSSFTTATGIKLTAGTVGTDQRGKIQEHSRPDIIWFDDFETRKTLRSAVESQAIWDNMEEARTSLAKDGSAIYTCNYISERGNVHRLVEKGKNVLIVPIVRDGKPTWNRYTLGDIEKIKEDAEDFEGEYLCEPSASQDVFFDRESVDRQVKKQPIKTIAGFRIYKNYDASHRYGGGSDVAGGVGLDHSTSVWIDFDIFPAQVVGVFANNEIKPDVFGDELKRQGEYFNLPVLAVENNKFDMCIGRLKQIYDLGKLYRMQNPDDSAYYKKQADYGWNTNAHSKPKMLSALAKAIHDGHLQLNDEALIREVRSYTRNDLMDKDEDVRLTTRHFDLLMACAIAWQMKDHATHAEIPSTYVQPEYEPPTLSE